MEFTKTFELNNCIPSVQYTQTNTVTNETVLIPRSGYISGINKPKKERDARIKELSEIQKEISHKRTELYKSRHAIDITEHLARLAQIHKEEAEVHQLFENVC